MTDLPGDRPQGQPQDWRSAQYPQPSQSPPPPGMYQYPPPPPGYPLYVPQPPINTYALLSLVLGVMVLPPLGIYLGSKAKKQIAVSGERGIEMARVGVIVGWILTGVYGLLFLGWCAYFVIFFAATR